VASSPFTGSTATVGTGTLTIELGAWNSGQTAFTPNASKPAVQIPITGVGDGSLANIRDLINDSGSGVSATIITDANGARLVLRGPDGEENGFRVSAQDDDGDNTDAAGLSALAFDPAGGVTRMTRTQAASNAQATINGLAVSSATNTFANVADGLSVTVNKVSSAPVQVSVSRDKASMTTKMQAMVTAYNDLVGTIRVQTLYDEASKTGGPLQGDSAANGLLRQIRSLMGSGSTGSSVFGRLSDLGISSGTDGRLKIDDTKLQKALDRPDEVRKLMATTDAGDANRVGLAERMRLLASQVTDSGGVIDTRKTSINATIDRNKDRMTKLDDRVALVEQRLRAQYTALDQSMTRLNGLSGYVTQQLNALSGSN
jgi:flagellar hook-associated protein 2